MADENTIRIKDQPTDTDLSDGDYVIVDSDNASEGTRKFNLGKELREIKANLGDLSELETVDKSNLVEAINEAARSGGGFTSEEADQLKDVLYMYEYSTTALAAEAKDKIDTLIASLKNIKPTSISVVYSGGSVVEGTNVNDLVGVVVTATYSDGTTGIVETYTMSPSIISVGSNTITVTYKGKTATFTVTGTAKPVASISAVYSGDSVVEGTDVDDLRTNITVTATYEDTTTATVTDYTISGSIVVGTNTLAITYGGRSTTITVTGTEAPKPNLLLTSAVKTFEQSTYAMYNDQIRVTSSSSWGTLYIVPVEAGKIYRYSLLSTNQYPNPYINNYQMKSLAGLSPTGTPAASSGNNPKTYLMGSFEGDYNDISSSYDTHFTKYECASTGASAVTQKVDGGYRISLEIEYSHDGYAIFAYRADQASDPVLNEAS